MKKKFRFFSFAQIVKPACAAMTEDILPQGSFFELKFIGVPEDKKVDKAGVDEKSIFVPVSGSLKILLSPGAFTVLDNNGIDGNVAFQLPNPNGENTGVTHYSIWAKALDKLDEQSTTATCIKDEDGQLWCSVGKVITVKEEEKSSIDEISKDLLFVSVDLDGDEISEQYPLFDEILENYFWQHDDNGMKIAQLRFYEIPTEINE